MFRLSNVFKVSLAAVAMSACASTPAASPLTVKSFVGDEKSFHVTSTLVLGEKDAVLVDAQFLNSEATRLVGVIKASGRQLTTVYITHAHPDHIFGLDVIHRAFPDARILAHPLVVEGVKGIWQAKHDQWKPVYGADLADTEVDPTPYDKPTLTLEGHTLQLIGPEVGDAVNSVAVFVPDEKTLITGDMSYGGVHPWLAETKAKEWDAWIQNLQRLEELKATTVVPGHRDPSHADEAAALPATITYIQDFKAAVAAGHSADDVVKTMIAKYPSLKMPIILDIAAKAAFGG